MNTLKDHLFKKDTRWIWWGLFGVIVAFLIFHAGVVVGSHRTFNDRVGERGFRPSFGMPPGFMMPDTYIMRGHGAVGEITAVTPPTMLIKEREGESETIYIGTTTVIDIAGHAASSSTLVPGAHVIIFGIPDEGHERINAKVIHILP